MSLLIITLSLKKYNVSKYNGGFRDEVGTLLLLCLRTLLVYTCPAAGTNTLVIINVVAVAVMCSG